MKTKATSVYFYIKMFFKKNKKIIFTILAIIFAALTAAFFFLHREPISEPYAAQTVSLTSSAGMQNNSAEKVIALPDKITKNANASAVKNSPEQNRQIQNPVQEQNDNIVKVSLAAGDTKYDVSVPKGATVYDAMTKLASSTAFSFSSTYYSGIGYFINAINGIKNANGNFWTLYVNGTYATVGASSYKLSGNENIEWKYTNNPNY